MTHDEKARWMNVRDYAIWVALDSSGRGRVFKAPKHWSMAQACDHAEKLFNDKSFVTVCQL